MAAAVEPGAAEPGEQPAALAAVLNGGHDQPVPPVPEQQQPARAALRDGQALPARHARCASLPILIVMMK